MNKPTAPFEKGQTVITDFYPKEKGLPRTVIRCYPSRVCQSGWLVDTLTEKGKKLEAIDSGWYQLAGENK